MQIRFAQEKDLEGINRLLRQVCAVHHNGRPDLFKPGGKKYTNAQLLQIMKKEQTPIFVAETDGGNIAGYAFCIFQQHTDNNILTDIKTLYIDDLCVDETCRGQHIGKSLYETVKQFAKDRGCYNVTLNVWSCNASALQFYEKCGLIPQKIGMECIL